MTNRCAAPWRTGLVRNLAGVLAGAAWVLCTAASLPADDAAPPPSRDQIEADGVKNGAWGFHTAQELDPWWQVDLQEVQPVSRVVVFNRCDHTAARASQLAVLLSADGQTFAQIYRHD
ncbi:MAG: discoidin domain-containing protein, partial [Pirellulaceae bacterium]|nr:discoidin domain-containing protein [Pirellulaceae bacterium]